MRFLIYVVSLWIGGCGMFNGELSYTLDVPIKTLPYSVTVFPFDFSQSQGGESFKKFHLDSLIGRELKRWKIFQGISFPQTAPSGENVPLARHNDLALRGRITRFEYSCIPVSPKDTHGQEKKEMEVVQNERSAWLSKQEKKDGPFRNRQTGRGWEWGENKLSNPEEKNENPASSDNENHFSLELKENKIKGELEFIIQIYGIRTNEKIYEKTYRDKISQTVSLFTATPESADKYVANMLLNSMLKKFLEDLAIDFYQYAETKDFILKTDLPPPGEWPSDYGD